jgi:hypothetical protein
MEYGRYGIRVNTVSPGGTDIPDRITSRLSLGDGAMAEELAQQEGDEYRREMSADIRNQQSLRRRGVPEEQGLIDHDIAKKESGPKVSAQTAYRRLGVSGRYSLVEAMPRTGRLHQIRRHFKHISCPLIGDVKYGKGEHNRHFREHYGLHRLALHSHGMALQHPRSGDRLELHAALPEDLGSAILQLGVADSLESLRADFLQPEPTQAGSSEAPSS